MSTAGVDARAYIEREMTQRAMPYAVNIRSDHPSSEAIRSLWYKCSQLEDDPSLVALNYAPHLTLAIYDDAPPNLFAAFDSAFEYLPGLTIRFDRLDYFEASESVILWAKPQLPDAVSAAHERIHAMVGSDQCRPHYRPGAWVPHCSLATKIDPSKKPEAMEFIGQPFTPVDVVFDVADCVSFSPIEVIREKVLARSA